MIRGDSRRTNATVDDIFNVRDRLVAWSIQVRDLTITRSLTLAMGSVVTGDEIQINLLGAVTINATTVHFQTVDTNELHLKGSSNQLTFGPSNQVTFNVETSNTTTLTVPTVTTPTAQFVLTEGDQTINGVKTFDDTVVFNAGFALASLTLTAVANQLTLGVGNTIVLTAPTPAASRVYQIPDVLANASFVMTEGTQTINGVKNFVDGFILGALALSDTSNQLELGTGQIITVNAPTPAASRVYTMPDVLANASFVMTEGDQTINGVKTFTSGFALASLILSDTSNQLTLGVINTIILNAPTPAATRTYTLPDVLANANFVMTEGNQTINGVKNFTSGFSFATITLSGVSNQIIMGAGNTVTINAPTPVASRTYTTPDVGANANFVMTEGNQTINGVKTFTSGLSFATLTLNAVSNQLTLGAGNVLIINGPTPAASRIYTLPDVGANSSFVLLAGAQTLTGAKTFSVSLTISATTNQFVLGTGNTTTITAPTPAASRVYTIPDAGGAASFVMTAGNQTVAGTKTFSSAVLVTPTTNQVVLGNGTNITVNAPTPAASRVYTMDDMLSDASFVMTAGAQTVGGAKTLSSALTINPTSNQLVLGAVSTVTVTAPTPAASRVYTIPDVLTNAAFVMTEGDQTINGVKTFTSSPVFPGLSFTTLTLTNTSNQLILGTGATITLNAPTPGAGRIYTIPDAGGAASFVMTAGTQAIAGTKTFSTAVTISPTTNQLVLGVTNTTTINSVAPAASRVYTIPDVLANASFVMTEGNQTINGVKTFTSSPVFPGLSFASLTLTNTTNQLTLGTGSTITLNAPTPGASRTYTIPDVGSTASFIMNQGTQGIAGDKIFASAITITPTTNQLVLGSVSTITITAPTPASSRTYTIPDAGVGAASFVMTAGTQTIAGAKTFSAITTFNNIVDMNSTLSLRTVTNQMQLGLSTTITINSVAPAVSRIYTIPDVDDDASFVMALGGDTITYEEFSDTFAFNGDFNLSPVPSVTVTFIRVGRQVSMRVPDFQEGPIVSPASSSLASTTMIPTRFRPPSDTRFTMTIVYNGNDRSGVSIVRSSGLIELFLNVVVGSTISISNIITPPNGDIGVRDYTQTYMVS